MRINESLDCHIFFDQKSYKNIERVGSIETFLHVRKQKCRLLCGLCVVKILFYPTERISPFTAEGWDLFDTLFEEVKLDFYI